MTVTQYARKADGASNQQFYQLKTQQMQVNRATKSNTREITCGNGRTMLEYQESRQPYICRHLMTGWKKQHVLGDHYRCWKEPGNN